MRGVFLTLALIAPALLPAQVLRGRVIEAGGAPVPRALVELRLPDGSVPARTRSGASGAYAIVAPGPGAYRLRVVAIGYSPHLSEAFALATNTVHPDVTMARVAVTLADIEVLERSRCGSGGGGAVLARLLDAARTSLDVMQATVTADSGFAVRVVRRTALATRRDSLITADTSAAQVTRWPIESVDPDSIRKVGFMVEGPVEGGTGYHWFGPDVRVLFAEWFLADHCYHLAGSAADGILTVRFEPTGSRRRVDIAGTLELDATTLALHRLTFEHRNLPAPLRAGAAGGEIRFAERGDGVWLPVEWRIRAPILGSRFRGAIGHSEASGFVIRQDG